MNVLTLGEAAKLLRCTRQTLYAKVEGKEVPYFRLGKSGHIRFDRDVLVWWARKQMCIGEQDIFAIGGKEIKKEL